jgi:hypothetical protein
MAICIYCAQAEGDYCIRNEAVGGDVLNHDVCAVCSRLRVWALFEDNHVGDVERDYDHEHGEDCPCPVCLYFYDTYDEDDEAQPTVQGLWDSLNDHIRYNFSHRVEYILSLRPQPMENIHPGQLRMFEDESPA